MAEEKAAENEKRISVAKIYTKDFSFEENPVKCSVCLKSSFKALDLRSR